MAKKLSRTQREEAREKITKRRKKARAKSFKGQSLTHVEFAFKPGTVLIQPHTWLLYGFFLKPLKQRLLTLAQQDAICIPAFSSFQESIRHEYIVEIRLRFQFKRVLNAWRLRQMNKKSSDLIDPVTLYPIRRPIYVYDGLQKRRYVFEADSLNKAIKKNLYTHQYTVPSPRKPVNLLTNKPFTYAQLVSIYDQLMACKLRIEDFSLYRKWQFRIDTWKLYMGNHLYMAAIKEELYNYQSADGKDMLEDFIKDMALTIKINLTERFELIITNAVNWYPEHQLLQLLRSLCLSSYESNTFQLNTGLLIANRFSHLFKPNYPNCDLWNQVWDRMVADSEAERALEQADIEMGR